MPSRRAVAFLVALASYALAAMLMNSFVNPLLEQTSPFAPDISTAANVVVLVVLGIGATFRPQSLHLRALDALAVVALAAGAVLLVPATAWANGTLVIVATCLSAIGRAGVVVLIGLAAAGLTAREALVGVTVALAIACAGTLAAWHLPLVLIVVLFSCLPLVSFALVFVDAQPLLDEASRAEAPADVAITRPSTFLPLASQLFACLFLFRLAFGYSLRFAEAGASPAIDVVTLVATVVLVIVTLAAKSLDYDFLTMAAFVLVGTGFFFSASADVVPHAGAALLACGNMVFDAVAWIVLIALEQRNRQSALGMFAWGRAMCSLGTLAGALLGRAYQWLVPTQEGAAAILTGVLLAGFASFALFGLHGFSFVATVHGVEPSPAEEDGPQVVVSPEDLFERRCQELADRFSLTPRELEVMRMLARGRDRLYIEEQLGISRNTVKAHVKHIYAKLDVHAHQDLIALVQDGEPALPGGSDVRETPRVPGSPT